MMAMGYGGVGYYILHAVRAMGTWSLHSLPCDGYGGWLLQSQRCEGYGRVDLLYSSCEGYRGCW